MYSAHLMVFVKKFEILFKSLERTRNSTEVLKQMSMQISTNKTDTNKETVMVKQVQKKPPLNGLNSGSRARPRQHSTDEEDEHPRKRHHSSRAGSAALLSQDTNDGNNEPNVDGPPSANLRRNPVSPSRLVDSGGMLVIFLNSRYISYRTTSTF